MLSDTPHLLQQIRLLDPLQEIDRIADILIFNDKIQEIKPNLANFVDNIPVIDAKSLILAPGLVDLYSHSGEPGYEERETLSSLINSAKSGGFTRINILPTTEPKADQAATLLGLQQRIPPYSPVSVHFWGTLTRQAKGEKMSELAELAATDIIGFTDNQTFENLDLLRRLLEYIKPLNVPIALTPLNRQLQGNGVMREGEASILYGLTGDPAISETAALTSILTLVEATETPVHFMRISTHRSVELIADAKKRGLPVTASVTWLHLWGNSLDLAEYNPNWRLNPPLGNIEDQAALIEGVKKGVIDAIAVDHTPYTYEEKTVAFADAPAGAIGFQLVLPLLWEKFVKSGQWLPLTLWKALSTHPCLCLNQPPITCDLGQNEFILFDSEQKWFLNSQTSHSLSQNTVWWNREITGRVISVNSNQ